jgi:ATP-dependent helicase HrpB
LLPDLPIRDSLPALRAALARGHAVLAAPPGSGKTTLVPLALRDEPWLAGRRILMLEPRRLAARAAAARMAELVGDAVGGLVGYQVRFDRQASARTRVEVLTEGVLTRRLQGDPELEGVGLVIFDEFHERSLHADLALALCLDTLRSLREDLRVLVMSATLDPAPVAALLCDAAVVVGEGRQFPVAVHYLERGIDGPWLPVAERIVRRALAEQSGDVLAFLPGAREIRTLAERLDDLRAQDVQLAPLFGDLPKEAQDAALRPRAGGGRRVVLATDIAETSLTIEGVRAVVDSGYCRQPVFDPNRGLTRLETRRVSQASAEQRAGRAGRLGPGACYRLWTAREQRDLAPRALPEILAADLGTLALALLRWGVTDPTALAWHDPPPPAHWAQALDLLRTLGLCDAQGHLTETGRRAADLGAQPRLAYLLLIAAEHGAAPLAADLAALLEERDPFRAETGVPRSADIEGRLHALADHRDGRLPTRGTDPAALERIERAARHWRRLLGAPGQGRVPGLGAGALLSLAFPDRIARRRGRPGGRYLLSSGRGAALADGDPLAAAELIVAAHLDAGAAEGRIHLAAAVTLAELRELHPRRIVIEDEVAWDAAAQRVRAERVERLGALMLSRLPLQAPAADAVHAAYCAGLREMGLEALPWDAAARQLQARVAFVRRHDPAGGWPDLDDQTLRETLAEWLGPWIAGFSRLEELRRLDLREILAARLDWTRRADLDRLAPETIEVPSGSRKRIDYLTGDPPVLAVKLQEMFGLADTPRLCDGRVPLMLHLLSPAQRPVQVTQDLRGFWDRGYAEVRKELRGRYPKHPWPEDPWRALATARTKSKS